MPTGRLHERKFLATLGRFDLDFTWRAKVLDLVVTVEDRPVLLE